MFKVVDPNSSIYIELTASGASHVVEFPPAEERAFVVGSTERASLRVSGVGVAPVQFHLEREDDAIWLIPAYGIADLTVNAISVLGPTPLAERSVIEFCDVRVYAAIREADPLSVGDDRFTAHDVNAEAARASYSLRLPGENDSTVLAMRPVRPSAAPPATIGPGGNREELRNTLSLSHNPNDSDMSATSRQSRVDAPMMHRHYQDMQRLLPNSQLPEHGATGAPDFTLYGTQIMAPYRPPPQPTAEIHGVPQRIESLGAPEPKVFQEARLPEQFGRAHVEGRQQPVPSRPWAMPREVPSTDDPTTLESAVTPPALGRHPLALATRDEDPVLDEERWRHRRATGITAGGTTPLSPLARLGLLTKARPLLVGCFTGVGAALLVVLFLGVTRLTQTPLRRPETRPGRLLADLKSLCPAPVAPVPTQAPTAASVSTAPAEPPQVHGSAGTGAPTHTAHPDDEPHKPDEQPRSRALH